MPEEKTAYEKLNLRQRKFVDAYLGECAGNALRAAEKAGYAQPQVAGCRLRKAPEVDAAIQERLEAVGVNRPAVLNELRAIAFGSIEDALEIEDEPDPLDETPAWRFNFAKARSNGSIRLIKKITQGRHGTGVEFYSKTEALQLLGKELGMFKERHEVSGPDGGPLGVVFYIPDNGRDADHSAAEGPAGDVP